MSTLLPSSFISSSFTPINPSPRIFLSNAFRCNNVVTIKDLCDIIYKMFTLLASLVATIKDSGDIIYKTCDIISKMLALLAFLVALDSSQMGETLFTKQYMPLVLTAVMVFFLLWIFYTLVLLDHHTTITTLFPISLPYGIGCAVSFAAFRIISPNIAIFNLALWLFVFILIAFIIYYQNHAFHGSELPPVAAVRLTVNGGGNISALEQLESVAGQPATQHKLDIGGDECVKVPSPCMRGFDRDCDGMVDLEENRDVMMIETDAP